MEPGLYKNMSREDYFALRAVSQSLLQNFQHSPAHVKHYMETGGDRTKAMALGDMVDVAVTEPERFEQEFSPPPDVKKQGKVNVALWDEYEKLHPHMVGTYKSGTRWALSREDYHRARSISATLWSNPAARSILDRPGKNQVAVVWNEPSEVIGADVLCRARLDRITNIGGVDVVVDLKTTSAFANVREWEREIANHGYHIQAGWYVKGLERLGYGKVEFWHLVVESNPPHGVRPFRLSEECLSTGQAIAEKYFAMWEHCTAKNDWPGYPATVPTVGLPAWAERDENDE